jgi:peptidoglycan/LPS O-acetylase OafA/YrhL
MLGARHENFALGLTGLRALAALMVLLFHWFGHAGPRTIGLSAGEVTIELQLLFGCGWMGANLFFVLSGFLLALPMIERMHESQVPVSPGSFLMRRIRRVVPAYWFQMILLTAIAYFASSTFDWRLVAAHFVFLQNFSLQYFQAINPVYWTLPTEFGFYVALPFAAMAVAYGGKGWKRFWLASCCGLVVFAISWRYASYLPAQNADVNDKVFAMLQLGGLIDHFAIGCLAAYAFIGARRSGQPIQGRVGDRMALAGGLGVLLCMTSFNFTLEQYWNGHPMLFVGYSLNALNMGVLVAGVAGNGPMVRMLLANPVAVAVGIISYSLYLWHYPILVWIGKWLPPSPSDTRFWLLLVIVLAASIVVSALSYWFVERPWLRTRTR